MEERGFPLFRNDAKDFNLNMIGIRTCENDANSFNDFFVCLWFYKGVWNRFDAKITTDAGVYWRENPMNVKGTAILKEGHHPKLWSIGKHRGVYDALTQTGLATVYRDNNKDEVLDMVQGSEEEGYFGINLHRANLKGESIEVNKWSAGCQVFANPTEYSRFMTMAYKSAGNWGNKFSYTLLLDEWFI